MLTCLCVNLGAFTPGCQARHLPPYIENLSQLKAKGAQVVAVIASNDAFVMSAWGKANGVTGDDIVSLHSSFYYLAVLEHRHMLIRNSSS